MHPRLVLGDGKGVLFREVSSLQGSLIEGFQYMCEALVVIWCVHLACGTLYSYCLLLMFICQHCVLHIWCVHVVHYTVIVYFSFV